ncbi:MULTISPECIES: TonB-dependent receptor domain-containing protein [unclassified Roseovarius]|uniref:TonB-dependent receptor domain-containing protein n=1 Tax=unclassified Roseovarius TaxID=2614913 RepID=UPI00273D6EA4|nr:TonB-dependent receptor [Roseovarius sp. MMSF_3350]
MNLSRLGILLITTAFLPVPAAFAQDAEGATFLGTIRIGSPEAQALLGNDEISEEEIEQRNPQSIRDVFDGETSVTTSGGAAIANKVFVNGIEESLLSVTIDGARQNKSAFHHTGNVLIDPALLKSVEVSKGLAPADAGPNALAGSLAYETKDAADLLEDGDNFGGMTTLTFGTNEDRIRAGLTLFGRSGGFEYLLSGTRSDSGSYEDGSGVTVPGSGADLTSYLGKFAYTSPTGHRLEFAASQTEDTGLRAGQVGPGGIIFIRPDFAGVTGRPSVLVPALSKRTSYTLTYTKNSATDWFDPFFQLSYNEQEIDASGVFGTNESFSGTFKNRFAIAGGDLSVGVDFFDESASGFGRGPGPFGSSGREDHWNIGIFAQARQDVGERASVSYGARYDWQEFEAANGQTFKDDGFSANGSVDFKITDALTLNAGYAHSWGGFELGEAALINFGAPWTYAGFTTSRSDAGRIGLRYERGPWQLSGAYFETYVNDINAVLPTGGDRGAIADLSSKGWEASVEYTWVNGFIRANYTDADVDLNGTTISSTAYYLGRPVGKAIALEGAVDLTDEWTLGGTAEIAFKNRDTPVPLSGYEVANLYATYTPSSFDRLQMRLDVRNIFDKTYTSRSSDGAGLGNVIALTEPGRSVSLTANLAF